MSEQTHHTNEEAVARAFNKQAALFDGLYSPNTIIQYKRERVRNHVRPYLSPDSHILELNAGTGEDAIYFARWGHHVHATDIAPEMLHVLREKTRHDGLEDKISVEHCSFTSLENLDHKGPYDMIFSNFAGLNCTGELDRVLASFGPLLKPGGMITLVLLPRFCLWETLLLCKGDFKTAFRRFRGKKPARAHIEGEYFQCWYYNPSYITRRLNNSFDLLALEGLCCFVPPSYIEQFADRHPRLYQFLKRKEDRLKDKWPWKSIGDYYIISLRKKSN